MEVLRITCCAPNLNPFKGDAVSDLELLSALSMPKLKPLGWLAKFDVPDGTPNLNCKVELVLDAGSFDFAVPGFKAWQATHCVWFASFCNKQESQFHEPSGFLNLSPNPLVDV